MVVVVAAVGRLACACVPERGQPRRGDGSPTTTKDQKAAGQTEAGSGPLFQSIAGCTKRRWCPVGWWRGLVALLVQCYRAMSCDFGCLWGERVEICICVSASQVKFGSGGA